MARELKATLEHRKARTKILPVTNLERFEIRDPAGLLHGEVWLDRSITRDYTSTDGEPEIVGRCNGTRRKTLSIVVMIPEDEGAVKP